MAARARLRTAGSGREGGQTNPAKVRDLGRRRTVMVGAGEQYFSKSSVKAKKAGKKHNR